MPMNQMNRNRMPKPECRCLYDVPSPAMVYPRCSEFTDILEAEDALRNGTLFRALIMPFAPGNRCGERGGNRR